MKTNIFLVLSIIVLILSCNKEDVIIDQDKIEPFEWEIGKNEFILNVDGVNRNLIIHVPISYDNNKVTPLVLMFHGSGGTGEKMYNTTEWVKKSEEEGFIVVFPTAIKYFVVSKNKIQTKWSKFNLIDQLPEGTKIIDDVPFVTNMIDKSKASFNIDDKRIFGTGFSNGGGFCRSRLMLEMSKVFATLTGGGGWGIPFALRDIHPSESVAQYYIMGNKDPKVLEGLERIEPMPMNIDSLFSIKNRALEQIANNLVIASGLDTSFIAEYNKDNSRAIYENTLGIQQENEVILQIVKGLLHKYPRPDNNPAKISAVDIFWEFNMQHPKK